MNADGDADGDDELPDDFFSPGQKPKSRKIFVQKEQDPEPELEE